MGSFGLRLSFEGCLLGERLVVNSLLGRFSTLRKSFHRVLTRILGHRLAFTVAPLWVGVVPLLGLGHISLCLLHEFVVAFLARKLSLLAPLAANLGAETLWLFCHLVIVPIGLGLGWIAVVLGGTRDYHFVFSSDGAVFSVEHSSMQSVTRKCLFASNYLL